jgi:hypothetical protein
VHESDADQTNRLIEQLIEWHTPQIQRSSDLPEPVPHEACPNCAPRDVDAGGAA